MLNTFARLNLSIDSCSGGGSGSSRVLVLSDGGTTRVTGKRTAAATGLGVLVGGRSRATVEARTARWFRISLIEARSFTRFFGHCW